MHKDELREMNKRNRKSTKGIKKKVYDTKKITSIINFGSTKYFGERVKDKSFIDLSKRCDVCEIKVGEGHEERKLYPFRGKMLCGECYDERNKHYN